MNSTRTVLYGYFAAKHQVMVRPYPSLEELWKRILITDQIDFVGGQILERTQPLLGPFFKGPTPVDAWGPAPKCGQSTPYSNDLDIQTVGNVTIVRRDNTGIPCSGCTRHLCAHYNPPQLSRCMQSISVEKVWNALCCHTPIGSTLL